MITPLPIQNRNTRIKIAGLLIAGLLSASSGWAASIGASFVGRNADPADVLNPDTDFAGVVQQNHWNNVRDDGTTFKGAARSLMDDAGSFTDVTILYDCSDSWSSNGNTGSGDEKLMKGIIKANPEPDTAPLNNTDRMLFVITNLPPSGVYNVIVYVMENDADYTQGGTNSSEMMLTLGSTTYYIEQEDNFTFVGSYVAATSTTPGTYLDANYGEFDNVSPAANGTITITARKNIVIPQSTDGIGVAGIQIVKVSGPNFPPNTVPVAITAQPQNRRAAIGTSTVAFTVGTTGPVLGYQWYKNGVAVSGATGSSYAPLVASGDNGALIHVVVSNNVNSVTSSNAVLTAGHLVTVPGAHEQLWFGHVRGDVESGSLDTTTPDIDISLPTFKTPDSQGDNYAERVSALFKPPTTGNYVFFVNSDDDSDLWVSTDATPANKVMVAQEIDWAADENWTGDDGGAAGATGQKRSDQFTPDGGATFPFSAGIPLTGGNSYYIEIAHHEGGGGDFAEATFKLIGDPDPARGSSTAITPFTMAPYVQALDGVQVTISSQPQNASTIEGHRASFSMAASARYIGDDVLQAVMFVQWQSAPSSSSTFTNIPGANSFSYAIPTAQVSQNGNKYRALIIAGDVTTNTSTATLTVIPDTFPPVPLPSAITRSDGAIQVGVGFDEAVNSADLVPGNFSFIGGTSATLSFPTNSYGDYKGVLFDTTGLIVGNTYTVHVANVRDLKGNAIPPAGVNATFTVGSKVGWSDTGTPIRPGQVIPVGVDGFDILNGGRQEWSSYDETTLAYVKKTNNFDVKVQVIYAEPGSEWTRVGLIARNGLDVGEPTSDRSGPSTASAYAQTHVNPNQTLGSSGRFDPLDPVQPVNNSPNNGHEQNTRLGTGTATSSWGSTATSPQYPDVWLRLQRQGAFLHGYRSTDGVTWDDQGTVQLTTQQPDMYVGPFLAVETGNIWPAAGFDVWNAPFDPKYDRLFVAQFRNFGTTFPPALSISASGGNVTITFGGTLLSAPSISGPWTAVSGATSPYTTAASGATRFFRAQD